MNSAENLKSQNNEYAHIQVPRQWIEFIIVPPALTSSQIRQTSRRISQTSYQVDQTSCASWRYQVGRVGNCFVKLANLANLAKLVYQPCRRTNWLSHTRNVPLRTWTTVKSGRWDFLWVSSFRTRTTQVSMLVLPERSYKQVECAWQLFQEQDVLAGDYTQMSQYGIMSVHCISSNRDGTRLGFEF